jgi:adenine-specific DNA-methyltransferase
MASLQKDYDDIKLDGRIYTPEHIVKKMLDELEYNNSSILGKKILDPACGDGRFLCEVAKRIIEFSSKEDLVKNLKCIFGFELNRKSVVECKTNLNELIKDLDISVDWNIKCCDSLKQKYPYYFDFIIANPPYVRIQHMLEDYRKFLQQNFNYCKKGATDLYIAFFELSLRMMKNEGKAAFITPNSYFSTQTAYIMRNDFAKKKYISKIINYNEIQIFENASTYSAITYFDKKKHDSFIYQKALTIDTFKEIELNISDIQVGDFWVFSFDTDKEKTDTKLGDICSIFTGIATLSDSIYIMNLVEEKEHTIILKSLHDGNVEIEKNILKPCIKASKYKDSNDPISSYAIFPYIQANNKSVIISEDDLENNYPLAYKYLLTVKHLLDKRDNGKPNPIAWYAYGRTQALDSCFGEKIIFSPINKNPNFIKCNHKDAIFYSGYAIKYKGDYDKLLSVLNSVKMKQFVDESARDFRSGWKSYNKSIIQHFPVDLSEI